MNLIFRVMTAALLLSGLAACEPKASNIRSINILTGDTSGVYYAIGEALSQVYAEALPQVRVSVQATQGSAENLNLLQAGRAEVAFSLGDTLSDAWKGNEEAGFKVPLGKLRVIAGMYQNYIQIIARDGAGIKTLADLKGKRISVGARKSGTELNARDIFRAAGLSYKDFARVDYLSFSESVELMKRRQLDVTLQSAGLGVASVRDLAAAMKIVVIPIPVDVVQNVNDSAYRPGVIPAKTYRGQEVDVVTATITNFLVTRENMPDDAVYKMTQSMFEHLDQLVKAHPAAKTIQRERAAVEVPVPLHPGAQKYYREVGLIR